MTDVSKSPERIAGMFDAIAGRYDFLNHLLSAGIDRRWRKRAIRSLALTGRERVVELCTGTAASALEARLASAPAAPVIGIDFAGVLLRLRIATPVRRRHEQTVAQVRDAATDTARASGAADA